MMCGAAASEKGNGLSRLGLEKTVSGSMGPYAMRMGRASHAQSPIEHDNHGKEHDGPGIRKKTSWHAARCAT